MKGTISGETPFKCLKNTFAVAGASHSYTLNYSATENGPWTAYTKATPANETLIVNGVTPYMWFKLVGNTDNELQAIF